MNPKPAHAHRPSGKRPKAAKVRRPEVAYPAGHFTELIRNSIWFRLLERRVEIVDAPSTLVHSQRATAAREAGNGWDRRAPLNLPGAIPHVNRWEERAAKA